MVKFLVERNSTSSLHGQVTIGILIFQVSLISFYIYKLNISFYEVFVSFSLILNFQDCVVGLLFALLPVLGGNSGLLQGIISMGKL